MESELAVEMSNLHMTFNEKDYVLDGIDLKIPKGEITIIIGFSGAGLDEIHFLKFPSDLSGGMRKRV